jgi:hypothetical protein
MRTTAIAVAVCLTAASLPAAERRPSIGSQVRALGPEGLEIKGTLSAYGANDLTITTHKGGHAVTIGFDRLQRLRVPDGRDHLGGFALGGVIGMGLAFAAALIHLRDYSGCAEGPCLLLAVYYGFVTVPVGAIVGTALAPTRWRDVPLPTASTASVGLGLRIAPVPGGARFALAWGF